MKTLLLSLLLFLCGLSMARAQPVPTTQCVTTAVAGGTGDAITIPRLPCVPTTTLLILTITAANTTTTPTITPVGGVKQTIVAGDGVAACPGDLKPGLKIMFTNDGTHWVAMTQAAGTPTVANGNMICNSITATGGKGDNTVDNVGPLLAAIALQTPKTCISFPPGKYKFASNVGITLPVGATLTLLGSGTDVTELTWPSGGGGFSITRQDQNNSVHVHDMTFSTGVAGGGTGFSDTLAVNRTTNNATSEFDNVSFRGADGPQQTDYWTTAINISGGASFYDFKNLNIWGPGSGFAGPSGNGIGVQLTGTASSVGVVYNFRGGNFNALSTGIIYGTEIQGVVVGPGTNFVGVYDGVVVPAGETGLEQLNLIGDQWACAHICVKDLTGVPFLTVTGSNEFNIFPGSIAVDLERYWGASVVGNTFNATTSHQGTGIQVGTNANPASIIDINTFGSLATGINILPAATNLTIGHGNTMAFNAVNVANAAQQNVAVLCCGGALVGSTNYAQAIISSAAGDAGAVCNGTSGNCIRLTVNSTTGFITGQFAMVNTACTGGGCITTNGVFQLAVVDPTHLDLYFTNFANTLTGNVTLLP